MTEDKKIELVEIYLKTKHMYESQAAFCRHHKTNSRSLNRWVEMYTNPVEKPKKAKVKKEPVYNWGLSPQCATISRNAETVNVLASQPNYEEVKKLILANDFEGAFVAARIKTMVERLSKGKVTIDAVGGSVCLNGQVIRNGMADKLVSMLREGAEGIETFCAFFEAVMMDVQSDDVREQLWPFLESISVEFCDDGSFIGYRAIRENWNDKFTNTMCNKVGREVSMPRMMVNADSNQLCAEGLHVGSLEYAKGYGHGTDRLVKVKCFVRDVVSVPYDYSGGKLRTCRFHVIEEVSQGDW